MAPQREWFETDFYQVLGVSSTATDKEITKAYRQLAKKYHPDANPGSEDRFKEISAAYDVLGDPDQAQGVRRGPPSRPDGRRVRPTGRRSPAGGTFRVEDMGDLGDIFGGLFGGGAARSAAPRGAQRGADVETEVHLSFEDAVRGRHHLGQPRRGRAAATPARAGGGARAPTHTCERCGGRGMLDDNQGMFSLSTICPVCNGRGTRSRRPCPTCHGTGTERRAER